MKRIFIITALALSIVALSVSCELNSRVTYYTVTFNSDGGSSVRTQKVEAGDSPIEPKDPTRGAATDSSSGRRKGRSTTSMRLSMLT